MGKVIPIEYLRHRKRKPRRGPKRITPEGLVELIGRHSFCAPGQHQPSRCPLVMSAPAMASELNLFFGRASEEDKAFRPCDPIPAAKPLSDHGTVEADHTQRKKNDPEEE